MGFEDTLLTQKQFEQAEKNGDWKDDYNPILNAQALKSFNAGIKEVVGFVDAYFYLVPKSPTAIREGVQPPKWQAKLKEWGV